MREYWCLKCRTSSTHLQDRIDHELATVGKANIHCIDGRGHDYTDQKPPEETIATHQSPYLVQ